MLVNSEDRVPEYIDDSELTNARSDSSDYIGSLPGSIFQNMEYFFVQNLKFSKSLWMFSEMNTSKPGTR